MPPRIAPGRGPPQAQRARGRGRGRGVARGGTVAIAAPAPGLVADHVQTVGVKRPGFGTAGRVIKVTTNTFATNITDGTIHQYDVITPGSDLSVRKSIKIFQVLQNIISAPPATPRLMGYDGRKIAYAVDDLQLGPNGQEFDVPYRTPGSRADRPPKMYKVKLTKTAEINSEVLHRFIAGQQTQDSSVATTLAALNVAIQMKMKLDYPSNTRSFFTPVGKRAVGAGIELWQGYFQSLRPGQNMMYTNIDISTAVMYKPCRLIQTSCEFLRCDPAQLAGRLSDSVRDRTRLEGFIKGLHIQAVKNRYVVEKISRNSARTHQFKTKDGKSTTVEEYIRKMNITLQYPNVPCVDVGKERVIPMELCEVLPEQFMRKQFPEDKINDMIDFARKRPNERLAAIQAGLEIVEPAKSPYVRAFGLDISQTPMTVDARVLMPPTLKYGERSNQPTIKPFNGIWNLIDKKLFRPVSIRKWAIVIFESERAFDNRAVGEMIKGFIDGARSVGITIPDAVPTNPLVQRSNAHRGVTRSLMEAGKAAFSTERIPPNQRLIVVVLPEGGNQIYTAVKNFGDVKKGVPTQCLKASKCRRAKPQYWANVMLKVNAKLGGINAILENSELYDPRHPTIVMGADVMHPPPGSTDRPSFTALVSSVDRFTAKYIAISKVQKGTVEIIDDMEEMVRHALQKYSSYRTQVEKVDPKPARLIFYRDGVSEGQFQIVLDQELPRIQKACKEEGMNPKITLIIVGKRHHIRMFPNESRDADKSGNCPAGTTIDQGLGHPTEFDYYQLTHGGLIGTSRPGHYSVIYDENNFSVDAIQSMSFALTHVYARATRSVSIPAPVYYADIVCARSRNHYTPDIELLGSTQAGSQASRSGATELEQQKQDYQPLHEFMSTNMYFM